MSALLSSQTYYSFDQKQKKDFSATDTDNKPIVHKCYFYYDGVDTDSTANPKISKLSR